MHTGNTEQAGYVLAIDFGTNTTVVAVQEGGNTSAELVRFQGQAWMPSAVFVNDDGGLVAGLAALREGAVEPLRLERTPKRLLGRDGSVYGDRYVSDVELAAAVLRQAAGQAQKQYNGMPARTTVLTHPVEWREKRLEALKAAARLAALQDVNLMFEPVAAATALARRDRFAAVAEGAKIAVFDFGGGTLDIALLERTRSGFQVLGEPGGDDHFGGDDLDDAVMKSLTHRLPAEERRYLADPESAGTPQLAALWRRAAFQLRMDAREAKERLTSETRVTIALLSPPMSQPKLTYTEGELGTDVMEYVSKAVGQVAVVLRKNGVDQSELAAIYLVGGSSAMPFIPRMIKVRYPTVEVANFGDPQALVALGAAEAVADAAIPDRRLGNRVKTIAEAGGTATPRVATAQSPGAIDRSPDRSPAIRVDANASRSPSAPDAPRLQARDTNEAVKSSPRSVSSPKPVYTFLHAAPVLQIAMGGAVGFETGYKARLAEGAKQLKGWLKPQWTSRSLLVTATAFHIRVRDLHVEDHVREFTPGHAVGHLALGRSGQWLATLSKPIHFANWQLQVCDLSLNNTRVQTYELDWRHGTPDLRPTALDRRTIPVTCLAVHPWAGMVALGANIGLVNSALLPATDVWLAPLHGSERSGIIQASESVIGVLMAAQFYGVVTPHTIQLHVPGKNYKTPQFSFRARDGATFTRAALIGEDLPPEQKGLVAVEERRGSASVDLRVFTLRSGREVSTFKLPRFDVMSGSPNGSVLAVASGKNAVLCDAFDGKVLAKVLHPEDVLCVALSGDGKWLATGAKDGQARIWAVDQIVPTQSVLNMKRAREIEVEIAELDGNISTGLIQGLAPEDMTDWVERISLLRADLQRLKAK